jgi:outer membrane beta-barrel protein
MRPSTVAVVVPACLWLATASAFAQDRKPAANEQVVVPQVDRRDVRPPRFPSNDFEFGLFAGTYATQNFGSSAVTGLRLGYHITEDIFVESALGRAKVSDAVFRQVFGAGIYPTSSEKLSYYNLSAGYNVLPGEVFFGRNVAKASAFYLLAGIGSTKFVDKKQQTTHIGFGTRLLFNDHFAVRADVRDHLFAQDILGKRQSTQNLEVTLGLTAFF